MAISKSRLPIEHLCEHIDRQIHAKKPSNKQQVFNIIQYAWKNIKLNVMIKLVDSMPARC